MRSHVCSSGEYSTRNVTAISDPSVVGERSLKGRLKSSNRDLFHLWKRSSIWHCNTHLSKQCIYDREAAVGRFNLLSDMVAGFLLAQSIPVCEIDGYFPFEVRGSFEEKSKKQLHILSRYFQLTEYRFIQLAGKTYLP